MVVLLHIHAQAVVSNKHSEIVGAKDIDTSLLKMWAMNLYLVMYKSH